MLGIDNSSYFSAQKRGGGIYTPENKKMTLQNHQCLIGNKEIHRLKWFLCPGNHVSFRVFKWSLLEKKSALQF